MSDSSHAKSVSPLCGWVWFFYRKCSSNNFHLGKAFGVLAFKSIAYSFKPHNVQRAPYTLRNQIPPKLLYAMNGIAEGIYSMANCFCNQDQFQNHVNWCWMEIHTFIVRCEYSARVHCRRQVVFVSVTSLIIPFIWTFCCKIWKLWKVRFWGIGYWFLKAQEQ